MSTPAQPPSPQPSSSTTEKETQKAAAKTTKTVSSTAEPAFGWNQYAEQLNGRFAMIGFIALLLLELFTRQDFFTWIGF